MTMIDNRNLIIRVGRNSLAFSTTSASDVVYEPYPLNNSISMAANLREALRTVPLLSETFRKTMVMVDAPVLMMPTDLFREDEQEQLYRHAFSETAQPEVVLHTVFPDLSCVAVFAIHKDLQTVVTDAFGDARFIPVSAPVWRHLHQRSYTGRHQKLYGYCHDRRLEVFSYGQNRFKFCNSYSANDPHDVLYYLLSAWKQLGMEAERDELYLVGDIPERDALLEESRSFVKRVFYINPSGEFNRSAVTQIAGMPYDLMTLYVKGR